MKPEKRFLITTALEETWVDDQPVLFLGEWCQLYSRKDRWSKMNAEVLPYHWEDRDKFYSDYLYLNGFYERVLGDLAIQLNNIHGTAHGLRYWRIFIGPWLAYFIQMLFDRWLSIHAALSHVEIKETIVIEGIDDELVPNDMTNFSEIIAGDEWNHHIYAAILERLGKVHCIKKIHAGNKSICNEADKPSFKVRVATVFAKMATHLVRDRDAFLIGTYLPFLSEMRLHLRLRQIPQWWKSVLPDKVPLDWQQRNWEMPHHGRSDFERFLLTMIPKQIPAVYLEGYQQLLDQIRRLPWPKSPKLIYTANVLWHDSVSMAYTAEKVEQGTPLVYGQHGGGYGTAKFHFAEEHEIEISDRYLTWGWANESNPNVVPLGIFTVGKRLQGSFNYKNRLLLMCLNSSRYTYLLCSESAMSFRNYFEAHLLFAAALHDLIQPAMLVRLTLWDKGWEQPLRWRDRFPHLELNLGREKIYDLMKKARVVVLTYNQTGILEALALGIPSVLFCDLKVTPLRDTAIPYYDELKRVGIFHDTPESAAAHVNVIWDDVDAWWTSADVQEVLARFNKQYCHHPENLLDRIEAVLHDAFKGT